MGITTRWLSATVLCDFQKVRETCGPWKFTTGVAKLLRLLVFLSPGFIWPSVEQISQRQLTHAIGKKDSLETLERSSQPFDTCLIFSSRNALSLF